MKFFENGKVFENEKAVISNKTEFIKLGNKYVYALFDPRNDWYHIFFRASSLKEAEATPIPREDKDFIEISLARHFNDTYTHSKNVIYCPENLVIPVGTEVYYGHFKKCVVLGRDNVCYYIKVIDDNDMMSYQIVHWSAIKAVRGNYFVNPRNNIRYYTGTISNLLHKILFFGCDMNPEYQRGNVWTVEQEEKLIDSIFKQINIGAFIFAEKDWTKGHDVVDDLYEIVDGKQRLTAILHFIEGKIKYNGLYYHEMHEYNRSFFEGTNVMIGEINFQNGYNKKEVIENFIRLNECGSTVDSAVIEKAKALKEECK